MNRIIEKFNKLKEKNERALIPFIMAGDPDLEATEQLVLALEKAGSDIIEIGIPYSDPVADGPVIQAASTRALEKGAKITSIMSMVCKIRDKTQVPLVFLVYYNSVFKFGMSKFMEQCELVGIDGLIIPDLPLEEREEIIQRAEKHDICIIPLVTPTSKGRIQAITKNGKGFVYCVSVNGVTGTRESIKTDIQKYMDSVSESTDMPKALGFGISSAEMAKEYAAICQGIIIGSAFIKLIAEEENRNKMISIVEEFASEVKRAITL